MTSRPPQTKEDRRSLRRKTARVAAALERHFGLPKRHKEDILECLVGCILSQNTTDVNSGRAFDSLRRAFPDWKSVLCVRPSKIAKAIQGGGLANQKSNWIQGVVRWANERDRNLRLNFLRRMSNEEVIAELTALPGVGVKTASIVLCFALRRDVCPVDTHVHRLCRRLGLVPEKASRDRTFMLMASLIPKGKAHTFHLNLIRHGRETCKARQPGCSACVIRRFCVLRPER